MSVSSSQLGGAIIGAAIGFFAGGGPVGAIKGAMIGFSLGGAFTPRPGQDAIEGPRISDNTVQTSTYGNFIPRVHGKEALYGNLIWLKGNVLQIQPYSEWQKVKEGGGNTTSIEIKKERALFTGAIGVCEGPCNGISKIWADDKLIMDLTPGNLDSLTNSYLLSPGITIYYGTESQKPDATIVSELGDSTPAYRGLVYVLFREFNCETYGNRLPEFRFEVVNSLEWGEEIEPGEEIDTPEEALDDDANAINNADLLPSVYPAYNTGWGLPWYYDDGALNFLLWNEGGSDGATPKISGSYDDPSDGTIGNTVALANMPYNYRYSRSLGDLNNVGGSGSYFNVQRFDSFPWDFSGRLYLNDYAGFHVIPVDNAPNMILAFHRHSDGVNAYISLGILLGGNKVRYWRINNACPLTISEFRDIETGFSGGYVYMYAPNMFTGAPNTIHAVDTKNLVAALAPGYDTESLDVAYYDSNKLNLESFSISFTGHTYRPIWGLDPYGAGGVVIVRDDDRAYGFDSFPSAFSTRVSFRTDVSLFGTQPQNIAPYLDPFFSGNFPKGNPASLRAWVSMYRDPLGQAITFTIAQESTEDGMVYLRQGTCRLPGFFVIFPANVEASNFEKTISNGQGGTTIVKGPPIIGEEIDKYRFKHIIYLTPKVIAHHSGVDLKEGNVLNLEGLATFLTSSVGSLGLITDTTTLRNTVEKELKRESLLTEDNIDLTGLDPTLLRGYTVSRQGSLAAALVPLQQAFRFDVFEEDYKLKFIMRGDGSSRATFTEADLQAREPGQATPPSVRHIITNPNEIPNRVEVVYKASERNGEPGYAYADISGINRFAPSKVEIPVTMNADEAWKTADILALDAQREGKGRYEISTHWGFSHLEKTHQITLDTADYPSTLLRIVDIEKGRPGIVKISAVREDANDYVSDAIGVIDPGGDTGFSTIPPSGLQLFDFPPLGETSEGVAIYWGAYPIGSEENWRGTTLYRSLDSGGSWTITNSTNQAMSHGVGVDLLGDSIATIFTYGYELTVTMHRGTLSTLTLDEVKAGGNRVAYGAPGRWEIMKFINAVDNGSGSFTLSGFLRGQQGTEMNMGKHVNGDAFILLDGAVVNNRLPVTRNLNVLYLPQSIGKQLNQGNRQSFASVARNVTPISPNHLHAWREANNDWKLSWRQRGRYGYEWINGVGQTKTDSDIYRIEVLDALNAVIMTITSSPDNYTLSEADQIANGGVSAFDNIRFRVAQTNTLSSSSGLVMLDGTFSEIYEA